MIYIVCDDDSEESAKEIYLKQHGKHFSKNMCEWAVQMMHKDGSDFLTKSLIDNLMELYNMYPKDLGEYDYVYLANFIKINFCKTIVSDDKCIICLVRDIIDNLYEGAIFHDWMHLMKEKQVEIDWEAML